MVSPTVDRRFGLVGNAALKAPVAAVATANITLSGQQTIDGVALLATNASGVPDRVLLTAQTDPTQNGIYDVSLSAWSRSADADGQYDFATGTQVLVGGGALYVRTVWCLTTTAAITVGTTALTWQLSIGASLGNFLQFGTGAQARTFTSKNRDAVSVMDFGAIADGTTHPLSGRYATLAAAQVDYPFATSLNQSIDWAACMAATNSVGYGGTVYVPPGTYRLSEEWAIKKTVTLRGSNSGDSSTIAGSILKFPADSNGLRFYSGSDSGTATTADRSRVENLYIEATAKNATGVGIYSTACLRIEYCIVRSFKGNGIELYGNTGGPSVGIVDGWRVSNTRIVDNGGHGLYVHGNDSQVGLALQVECSTNTGWGYRDEAAYSNTYIACQSAGNTAGAFYNLPQATYYNSVYIGCYTETFANSDLNGGLVIGGVMDWQTNTSLIGSMNPGGAMVNVPTSIPLLFFRNGIEGWRWESDNTFRGISGITVNSGSTIAQIDPGVIGLSTTTVATADMARFNNPNGRVGSIQTTGSATAYNTSSDYRLKTDVQPMAGALAKVMLLKPVTYKWKVDGAAGEGFIAHELQEVVPGCVSGKKDETEIIEVRGDDGQVLLDSEGLAVTKEVPRYQGMDTSFLVATLTAALQELNAKFDAYIAAHP